MKQLVILISGRGSNMIAIHQAIISGQIPANLACVISDQPQAAGLEFAKEQGIPTLVIKAKTGETRQEYDQRLQQALLPINPDYIILAGFMRILSAEFIAQWLDKIVNIHPSLLPAYRGLDTHRRALENGDKRHGCTVHFVRAELDTGPILGQAEVDILPHDTPQSLADRVLAEEHRLYPHIIAKLVRNATSE